MSMSRFYIDSNVFVYAKIMDRVFGKSCSKVLRQTASKEIDASTSALVPIEVANALRKYGFANDVTGEIRAIFSLGIEIYPVNPEDAREAAELYSQTKISPHDCTHAAIMRRNGLTEIISVDKEFDKLEWLKRVDPRSMSG